MARGTARGGAPSARLAIYKVCWFDACNEADILSAMDDSISDGVDILSLSLGPHPPQPSYFEDAITIGAFHAFRSGILVSAGAGNSAFPGTAINVVPWILTVAASTIDRELHSNVYLGNSKVLKGSSLNPIKMESYHGLIAGRSAAAPGVTAENASFCKNNMLDPTSVKGKIVVCTAETFHDDRTEKSIVLRQAGAVGIILIDPLLKEVGSQFVIPGTLIGQEEAEELQAYLIKFYTKCIFLSQPDITGPGVNILAAWSPVGPKGPAERSVDYNIASGTSMSCPHASAVAAVLKSYHPSWSPAAIKSFDYVSGHINPTAALNPGLVYDFNSHDVINFLCSTGANPAQLKNLTGELAKCKNPSIPSYNFNYPSIGVSNMNGSLSVYRTVTYYGKEPTTYVASIDQPTDVEVKVTPDSLRFTKTGEKLSFRVDFIPFKNSNRSFVFGALTWGNCFHRVRSPIGLNVVSV